jgi:hypothetical protein
MNKRLEKVGKCLNLVWLVFDPSMVEGGGFQSELLWFERVRMNQKPVQEKFENLSVGIELACLGQSSFQPCQKQFGDEDFEVLLAVVVVVFPRMEWAGGVENEIPLRFEIVLDSILRLRVEIHPLAFFQCLSSFYHSSAL